MKLLFFINAFFSISYACSRFLVKPYVLDLVNSKGFAKIKKTACFPNLHYLITNPDVHYLAKLPVFRALFRTRLPAFLDFCKNLKLGPSATNGKIYLNKRMNCLIFDGLIKWFWKGILKKLWLVPAFRDVYADPNIQKLFKCRCWPKLVDLISDPNLFKCMMDPAVILHVTSNDFNTWRAGKYSILSFLQHKNLNEYKRFGKVPFVQCKTWFIFSIC